MRIKFLAVLLIFFVSEFGVGICRAHSLYGLEPPSRAVSVATDENNEEGQAEPEANQSRLDSETEKEYDLGPKEFIRDTLIHYGFMWFGRFFYVRNKNDRIFDTSFSKWIDNITSAPVSNDQDDFVTNFINHPIFGAEYYLYYRAMGHSFWASALGSLVQSTLFEYAVEGLVEEPSLPDLIFTPLLGVPLGYGLEVTSDWLTGRDNIFAKMVGRVLNPMKLLIEDRKIGVLNPVSGNFFSFRSPIVQSPGRQKAVDLAYPFFLESPLPITRFTVDFEVVSLDEEFDGEFIFYSLRADFSSPSRLYGLYFRVSQAGVNNVGKIVDRQDDGFEFSNTTAGAKFLLYKARNSVLSGGLEFVIPTAFKDNIQRLETITNFRRNFPIHLRNAWTIMPYFSAAAWDGPFSVQANLGVENVFNADKLEGDWIEGRVSYALAGGVKIPVFASPAVFAEFSGDTFYTEVDEENTNLYLGSGVRFGDKFSPGVGVQLPVVGNDADIANLSVIVDFQTRF